jgi:Holliday junction resolvasome RuvABC endonuclease subunit
MLNMIIFALDLATKTGWAINLMPEPGSISGVQDFSLKRGESPGMRYVRIRSWLYSIKDMLTKAGKRIDIICHEQSHHRGGAATQIANGLIAQVQAFAAENNYELMPVHTASLKKFATGRGNASKEEMVNAAILKGYQPQDDNEADALHLLDYAKTELLTDK